MNQPSASPFRPLCSPAFICLLLVLAVVAIYAPVRHYGFVDYDDSAYFFANPHVLGGLTGQNIEWAFTSGEDANWHPLTWLSLMLDATLFGKGAAAPHITNVLLHAANSILVFLLLLRTTSRIWRSAAVAMLFAIHPLHVESVAWVSERKDVLSGFFGLLTLLCYAGYAGKRDKNRWLGYRLALLFFVCGLLSKPMVVTLPFVMLLMDYWPLERFKLSHRVGDQPVAAQVSKPAVSPISKSADNPNTVRLRRLLWEKAPFFILCAAASVVTFLVQQKGGAVTALTRIPMGLRVENTFISYTRYLAKIFFPVNLATPYPAPVYQPIPWLILSVALFIVFCLAAVALRKRFPFAFTGWFWFVGMLVPVIGLVQVGGAAMSDRYAYLPIIGILIIGVWGVGEICLARRPSRRTLLGYAALLFFVCALRARNQVATWENDQVLFGHALSVTKNNYTASLDLGYWYSKKDMPGAALDYYHKALQMGPDDPTALYNVGNALTKLGRWDEAIQDYRHALEFTPNEPDILDNLGYALAQTKQLTEAAACFQAVIQLKPNSLGAHNNLATIYFVQGNYKAAAEQYSDALKLSPDNPRIVINLADTLVHLGDKAAAAQYYQRALELQPDNQSVRDKLQSLGPQ